MRPTRAALSTRLALMVPLFVVAAVATACKQGDPDEPARTRWLDERTASRKVFLRRVLKGTPDIRYSDGWYPLESDPTTGSAWRWQEKKSRTRFRVSSIPPGDPVRLSVFGWTDFAHLDVRSSHLDFYVNGVRIDRFDPPPASFEHVLLIPRRLIGGGEWVDLDILAANTARPSGEWRDLGFATTGFLWRAPDWVPEPAPPAPLPAPSSSVKP